MDTSIGTRRDSRSRGEARLLASVLPNLEFVEFDGLGRMGPITHPEAINATIGDFLRRSARNAILELIGHFP